MAKTKYLGQFIRECRTTLGLTSRRIEELSSKGGCRKISHSNLLAIERGDLIPTYDKILTLSLLFNVPTHHFEERLKLDMLGVPDVPEGVEHRTLMEAGREYLSLGEYEKAMECFTQSYIILEKEDLAPEEKKKEEFDAKLQVANCRRRIGIPSIAKDELEQLIADDALPEELVVKASFVLAEIYRDLHNYRLALRHAREAMELASDLKDEELTAKILNTMANIYYQRNDSDKAIELFRRSMKFFQEAGKEGGVALVKRNLAMCYASKEDFTEALRLLEEGLSGARSSRDARAVVSALAGLQKVHYLKKNYNLSRKYGQEAKEIAQEREFKDLLFFNLFYLWKVAEEEKKTKLSKVFLERLRSLHRKVEVLFPEIEEFRKSLAVEGY